jgi:hypothetical protein
MSDSPIKDSSTLYHHRPTGRKEPTMRLRLND